jgi:hypothetical protein
MASSLLVQVIFDRRHWHQVGDLKVPVYQAPDVKPVFVHPIPGYGGHLEVRI